MTTVAWDGKTMAADTLATDTWGLKFESHKIIEGRDFLLAGAGEVGQIRKWWVDEGHKLTAEQLIAAGYSHYEREKNEPALLLACVHGVYRHSGGVFLQSYEGRCAIGSGRNYALAAMYLGKTAEEAVKVAAHFDSGTNDVVDITGKVW